MKDMMDERYNFHRTPEEIAKIASRLEEMSKIQ
jgi:hypothetical protein